MCDLFSSCRFFGQEICKNGMMGRYRDILQVVEVLFHGGSIFRIAVLPAF